MSGRRGDRRMKVFWHDAQLKHAPKFFLARGETRPNFEVPARAEALLASCRAMQLDIVTPDPTDRTALLRCTMPLIWISCTTLLPPGPRCPVLERRLWRTA